MKQELVAAGFVCLAAIATAQTVTRGPYIQNLDQDSVSILWRTDRPSSSYMGIREKGKGEYDYYYSNIPAEFHELNIPNLKPNTEYEYTAAFSRESLLPEKPFSFTTFPDTNDAKFSFLVYGDHRNNATAHRSVVEAAIARIKDSTAPSFVLDTGDFTGQGEHPTDFWDEQFFIPATGLIEKYCYFPVIGNHESGRAHPRIPFRYLRNFAVPTESSGTEYYYSFDYGNAHMVMLDVYSSDFATGSKQWEWLRRDLRRTTKRWRFVVAHYPVFIHRSGPSVSYGNEDIRTHLVPLFEEHGVTAVFSGDSHFYQRSEVNGVHYICSGGGGAPLYDPGNGRDYVRASAKTYHYVQVSIDGDEMHMQAFDPENNLLDELKTAPRIPALPEQLPLNFVQRLPDATMKAGVPIIIESRMADGSITPAPAYRDGDGMASSTAKSTASGLRGQGSRFSDNDAPGAWFEFTPELPGAGLYLISITVPDAGSVQAPKTLFEVRQGEDVVRGRVDLSYTSAGNKWFDIGLFEMSPGVAVRLIEAEDEPSRFYSDAMRFVPYTAAQ